MLKNPLRLPTLAGLCWLLAMPAGQAIAQTPSTPRAAPAPASAAAAHPLTGTWNWTLPGKTCSETLQYRPNGSRLATSGEQVTDGDYEITRSPSTAGFYRLTETVTQTNGKPDCYGDLQGSNEESVTRFIQFSPAQDQFIVCKAESLQACFGPLRRVP